MIKWLFFDLGATLVNEDYAHKKRIIDTVHECNCCSYEEFYNEMIEASKNYQQPYPTAIKKLKIDTKIPYPKECELLYDDALPLLERLHTKFKIGIIANQSAGSEKRLTEWKLIDYIDEIFASAEVGLSKPDTEFFKYALKTTGANANESVMIGDRLDNDIYPAKKLGFRTIWIKQGFGAYQNIINDEYKPDFTVKCLTDIETVLLNM